MFNKKIGIDLGTANSLVYVQKQGVILREPTVVAVTIDDEQVVAVGDAAREMLGKTPEGIVATKPLKSGVIADYVVTEALIRYFITKAAGTIRLFRPDVLISIPAGATSVEARAVLDAAFSAGVKNAYLIPEPLAAAIGTGLPISEPTGNMIVNIGGGTTEIAIVSLYGMVTHGSVRVAGNTLDEAIILHLRRRYNLIVGENTAEKVKKEIGSAYPLNKEEFYEVKGRDSISGFPKTVTIGSNEITECFTFPLQQIAVAIKNVLEKTPPELSSDVLDKGIVLSGGTALLKNLDKYLTNFAGVPVHVSDEPLNAVINGIAKVLDNLSYFEKSLLKK